MHEGQFKMADRGRPAFEEADSPKDRDVFGDDFRGMTALIWDAILW
jgi:hypothetical protein